MFYGIPEDKHEDFKQATRILQEIFPNIYGKDMLITMERNLSFMEDEVFLQSFNSHVTNDQEKSLLWRLHVLAWAANHALSVDGDFVECGVFKGFCSAVLCEYLDFNSLDRKFYLYDTFSGLPEETSTEEERNRWAGYRSYDPDELYRQVSDVFSRYRNVEIIKGVVPSSFKESCPNKIAFLHIDMNSAEAEILALEHLFDKISPGGIIVLDDFGWTYNINQNFAERRFMAERQHYILELPTGQGVVIKHA